MHEIANRTSVNEAPIESSDTRRARRLGFGIWLVARSIFCTLRMEYEGLDQLDDLKKGGRGGIVVVWHGRSLIPANVFYKRGYWALISLSRDGSIQNEIFQRFGFHTIRGSTGRGGIRAALTLTKKISEGGVLAFTPDGPRGPTHKVQGGTIFLAQKSQAPIFPIGASAKWRRLTVSWDQYLIPLPFSKAVMILGKPIELEQTSDEEVKNAQARRVEIATNRVEQEAERRMGYSYPKEWPIE